MNPINLTLQPNGLLPNKLKILAGIEYYNTCKETEPKIAHSLLIDFKPSDRILLSYDGYCWSIGNFDKHDKNTIIEAKANEQILLNCGCSGRKLTRKELRYVTKTEYCICHRLSLQIKEKESEFDLSLFQNLDENDEPQWWEVEE